jgi:nifR3 family TIM-barrel protein
VSTSTVAAARPLPLGPFQVWPPVVLAPMAGVTNAPFRTLCRRAGAGLCVSEMVLAKAVVHGNTKTARMCGFADDELPRSIQLYGTDPVFVGEAVRLLVAEGQVDHLDLNFGCPMPKVTRNGGGSAVPLKPRLLAAIVRSAVQAAGAVPVTMKFRIGVDDDLVTFRTAGRVGEDEGCAWVALHARTAEQCYSGRARWEAIGELKEAVTSIPVLGNGDIWEASDASAMVASTGCDGVVVGRGCLGRPWLFGELAAVFEGREPPAPPTLGTVAATMAEHARLLLEWMGERGIRDFRKHAGWYLTGFPVGPEARQRLSNVSSVGELDELLARLDHTTPFPLEAGRLPRGHTQGPRRVVLPEGFLDDPDAMTLPDGAECLVNGG